MKRADRLSVALHVLLHLAQRPGAALTSEEMAVWADTHPVVIRRSFAGLREAGIVSSLKGHGGGWRLARPAEEISLGEVRRALGEKMVVLVEESPGCLVEQAVHRALSHALIEADAVLERQLDTVTLADLAADVGPAFYDFIHSHEKSHKHGAS